LEITQACVLKFIRDITFVQLSHSKVEGYAVLFVSRFAKQM
jgi:hypothetical protein